MRFSRQLFTFITIISFTGLCLAQERTDTLEQEPNILKLGLSAGNNIIQNGRKMSSNTHYFMPACSYFHSSGWYTAASLVYMINTKKPLDNVSINIGYDKDLSENVTLGIDYSYSKYFSTKQVKSGIPHTLTLSSLWYNPIVSPGLYVYYTFGNVTDITLGADISHSFIFKKVFNSNDKLSLPIVVGAYMGTLNFYNDYVKKNSENNTTPPTYSTQFGLTSMFCTATLRYRLKSFGLGLMSTYNAQFNAKQKAVWAALPIYKIQVAYYF